MFAKLLPKYCNLVRSVNIYCLGEVGIWVNGRKGSYMHKLIDLACRRTAGVAAGAVLLGGMAGGVLLTPGTAFATTTTDTTTAIASTSQTSTFSGTTLNVQVTVTPASGTVWPGGQVNVSDGAGGGCVVTLAQDGPNGLANGSCNIANLQNGSYTLTAGYQGSPSFSPSGSNPETVWIKNGFSRPDLHTYLNCTSKVFIGQHGSCTLWVTNAGWGPVQDVSAQIALPWQLRADYCGYFWSFGCTISGNTAYEDLGTLRPGQTKSLTVVFNARTGFTLWGWHRGHRLTVRVVGSASAYNNQWFFGAGQSFSAAWVTIIPQGWWW
jgi:hypothetical protein